MKKVIFLLFVTTLSTQIARAQSTTFDGSEVGVDLAFSASTNGGSAGLGLKYGLNLGEYFIFGPSARYEFMWWKNYVGSGQELVTGNRSVYGGGVFGHARFFNALFAGVEFEMLRSPYNKNGFLGIEKTWAPTLFLGGGFSMEFNESFRFNAGIMYDVINATNSPFRRSYFIQKKTTDGTSAGFLPIIYRFAFFFPIS
jgi:hypothetical protein